MSSYALVPLAWLVLLELSMSGRSVRALVREVYLAGLGVLIRVRLVK